MEPEAARDQLDLCSSPLIFVIASTMHEVPNIRHLAAFLAASRYLRLGRAADIVSLSQPATTQAIRKLELGLGQRLFERTNKGLKLTPAGGCFQARIERAFELLREGQRVLGTGAPQLCNHATRVQLRALIATVEHGSYSLAARALGVSQPSVHRAARKLETLCRQQLFAAKAQGVDVTPAARELARHAALALAEIGQGIEELRELRGQRDGRVWIGCLPLGRTRIVPQAVTRLLARYPDVKVRIVDGAYGDLLNALRHGQIDIMFGALRLPPPAGDFIQEALFSEPLSLIVRAGHPILTNPRLDAHSLSQCEWVLPREGTPARDSFTAFFRKSAVPPPQRIIECSSLIALRALLSESDRIGLLSIEQVRYEVDAGFLKLLPAPMPHTERPIGLTFRKHWLPTTVQNDFIALLRRVSGGGAN
jgi:DNA-binding transcriptional LysR family regulator